MTFRIDLLLHGGLRVGQLTELVGPSSSGKTQVRNTSFMITISFPDECKFPLDHVFMNLFGFFSHCFVVVCLNLLYDPDIMMRWYLFSNGMDISWL